MTPREWDGDVCIRKECRKLPAGTCEHEVARRASPLGVIEDAMSHTGLRRMPGIAGKATADPEIPRNTPKPGNCNDEDDGYFCVLAPLHVDDHEAYDDATGNVLIHTWPQRTVPNAE